MRKGFQLTLIGWLITPTYPHCKFTYYPVILYGFLLIFFLRPCVLCLAVSVQTADIADTDTVCVLSFAVCADFGDITPGVYASITVDYIVVAYSVKPSFPVPAVYVRYRVIASLRGRATVDYHFVYLSHFLSPF